MNAFRHIARWTVTLTLLLSLQGLLVVQTLFILRQDYVIENLCENREQVDLDCEGVCYLTEQIALAEQKRQERQTAGLELLLTFHLYAPAGPSVSDAPSADHAFPLAPYTPVLDGPSASLFRPPRLG